MVCLYIFKTVFQREKFLILMKSNIPSFLVCVWVCVCECECACECVCECERMCECECTCVREWVCLSVCAHSTSLFLSSLQFVALRPAGRFSSSVFSCFIFLVRYLSAQFGTWLLVSRSQGRFERGKSFAAQMWPFSRTFTCPRSSLLGFPAFNITAMRVWAFRNTRT